MNDTILLGQPLEHFEAQLSTVLKSLREGDLLSLGASPLAYTSLVEEGFLTGEPMTADGRGRILRALLRWGIERLRPEGEPSWGKALWRHYNILYHFYLEGTRASTLAEAMAVAERFLPCRKRGGRGAAHVATRWPRLRDCAVWLPTLLRRLRRGLCVLGPCVLGPCVLEALGG